MPIFSDTYLNCLCLRVPPHVSSQALRFLSLAAMNWAVVRDCEANGVVMVFGGWGFVEQGRVILIDLRLMGLVGSVCGKSFTRPLIINDLRLMGLAGAVYVKSFTRPLR